MKLTLLKGFTEQVFQQLQTLWSQPLNSILSNTILQGLQLAPITLVASTPLAVNHLLSRPMQGWFIVDITAAANVYRTQPLNAQTITLESTADCQLTIWVY